MNSTNTTPEVGQQWIIKWSSVAVPVTIRRINGDLIAFQAEGRHEGVRRLRHFLEDFKPYTVEDEPK